MLFKGIVWKFGSNVDTDAIISGKYLNITDPHELAEHCMEDLDPDFHRKAKTGDIIVADNNFGCGSSREHAPLGIKAIGISCVIAKTFARIFYRNAFNIGLTVLECPEGLDQINKGDEIEVNLDTGEIRNLSNGQSFLAKPVPPFMQDLIRDGGLMNHLVKSTFGNRTS